MVVVVVVVDMKRMFVMADVVVGMNEGKGLRLKHGEIVKAEDMASDERLSDDDRGMTRRRIRGRGRGRVTLKWKKYVKTPSG